MAAPNFTQPLEPVSVAEGQPAVFRAAFSGQPNPVVKWYRYSFPVHDSKDFKIFTTDTESALTIAKTCADDSGVFTCLLENIVGAAKSSSNLNVMEAGQEYVMQVRKSALLVKGTVLPDIRPPFFSYYCTVPTWVTDHWVKLFSILVKKSPSNSNFSISRGYHTTASHF